MTESLLDQVSAAGPSRAAALKARTRLALRVGALLLALAFLAGLLAGQWRALQAYPWQVTPAWLAVALVLLWLAWLLELNQWRFILGRLGGHLTYRYAARVWFVSNLVRYIPGNVWQFLGMAELCADAGVSRTATLTSIVLHQAISTTAGLLLAALYFALAGHTAWLDALRPALWLAPLSLLVLHPRILQWVLNRALRVFKRPPMHVTLTLPDVARLLGAYALVWLGMGLGFSALTRAFTGLALPDLPWLVAAYAAAYVLGYLSLLAPSGLGVREGVLVLLLQPVLPPPLPALVAVAARLWMIVGELGGAAVSSLLARGRPARGQANPERGA